MKTKTSLLVAVMLIAFTMSSVATGAQEPSRSSDAYYTIYSGEVTTLNYLISGSENEHFMFANTVDNLVEYDKYGALKPSLAESWTSSPDGLTWTFKLRKGVQWFTWDGKPYAELAAQDWVDAAKYIMNKANASSTAAVLYQVVKNGEDFWEGKITDFSQVGVKAIDDYTLQYTLQKPVPYFLSMLSYVTFLPVNGKFLAEQGSRFGLDNKSILYNGAYIMSEFEPQVTRVLTRNAAYWDAANVFIPRQVYRYNREAATLSPELFQRGEISMSMIPSSILDTWTRDPARKDIVVPARYSSYTYFYAFNFNPKFAAEYEPDNWKLAVNNLNFRKALFHAMDRKAAHTTLDPYNPQRQLSNTITPVGFANAAGKDFVDTGALAAFAQTDSFNRQLALDFKAKAIKDLSGTARLPVKVMMPYNTGSTDWTNRVQVIEQQMEGLLGQDFIDIIPVGYPATGFLNATRRAGNYAFEEVNWGPDYADPETYTDPFTVGSNYNWPELATGYPAVNGEPKYESMIKLAKAEVVDMKKRYELFAAAEAFLIDQAFVIPYRLGGGGYMGSKLEPYSSPFASFGMSNLKYKGQVVLPKPITAAEYLQIEAEWTKTRGAALSASK
ncbi:MAG: peptide ABC transporter substrate-binding protein [Spirochaetota bacterium]